MDMIHRNRKYVLAMFAMFANTVALFTGVMEAQTYILGQGVILGMYNTANVLKEKK